MGSGEGQMISASILERAAMLRAEGQSWSRIKREVRVSADALRMRLEPGFAAARREKDRRRRARLMAEAGLGAGRGAGQVQRTMTPDEARRAIESVPMDTRDLTARLLGDPLPGRSALDKQKEDLPPPNLEFFPANNTRSSLPVALRKNVVAEGISGGQRP